jgi:C4-dicarboxylate-specific signal transduction histidine kinase
MKLPAKTGLATLLLGTLATLVVAYIAFVEAQKVFFTYNSALSKQTLLKKEQVIKQLISKTKQDIHYLLSADSVDAMIRAKNNPYLYDKKSNMTYGFLQKRMEKLFSVIASQNPYYLSIRMYDAEGKTVIGDESIKRTLYMNTQIEHALTTEEGRYYTSEVNLPEYLDYKHAVVFLAKPLYINKELQGLYMITLDLSQMLQDILEDVKTQQVFVIDDNEEFIYHPDKSKIFASRQGHEHRATKESIQIKMANSDTVATHDLSDSKVHLKKIMLNEQKALYLALKETQTAIIGESDAYLIVIISTILGVVMILGVLVAVIISHLTRGIPTLTELANHSIDNKIDPDEFRKIKTNDEIETLANAFASTLEALNKSHKKLQNFANSLEDQVAEKTKELQKFNDELSQKIEDGINELRDKDSMLVQQSKMAAMGEMIGSIAHQWRQPLNALALSIQGVEDSFEMGKVNLEYLEDFTDDNMKLIHYMSHTIDDFRNFFKPDKEKVKFSIRHAVDEVLQIQGAQLEASKVKLSVVGDDFSVNGFENEFKQVVLNIVNNARDQLDETNASTKNVTIMLDKVSATHSKLMICDTAGGVPEHIVHRLFDPYFTTKGETTGTGLGLYMSKMIIEQNMQGKLYVKNNKEGACFTIELENV